MKRSLGGFTLIEVMIFLAVTSFMFASALLIFRGQQASTQFSQSMRQFESAVSDVINDTTTGVYPELNDITCEYSGGAATFTPNPGTASGENNSCVFLGKVIQLGVGSISNAPNEFFNVHTLIGDNRTLVTNNPATLANNFAATNPSALYHDDPSIGFDTVEELTLQWGSRIKKAFYIDDNGVTQYVRGVGILYSRFGQINVGQTFVSGSANISLYAIKAIGSASQNYESAYQTPRTFAQGISQPIASDFVLMSSDRVDSSIFICVEGGEGQNAAVELGNAKGSITARTSFDVIAECRT